MSTEVKNIDIFSEINPNDNESFSSFSKKDLEDLLHLINSYKLMLRERIGVPLWETFGLEIECEHANWDKIARRMEMYWILDDDLSLDDGAEIKSPKLNDTKESWITLRNMCTMISKYAEVGINSGGHVHIGRQALGEEESLINFMKLWAVYEPIIYRFSYGEFLGPRPGINDAAKSVQKDFANMCYLYEEGYADIKKIVSNLCVDKYLAVNFKHYNTLGTLEFRCPNATLNPVIWQNNVNLFVKMMLCSKKDDFNKSIIDEKIHRLFTENKSPNEINVSDAIEFADLVFDNNLDKIYFLRQYLKSFEVSSEYELAKSFTLK